MSLLRFDPDDSVATGETTRPETLVDGVFAIVMTLLVFNIQPPDVPSGQLVSALEGLWYDFVGFLISFALLGIYWVGHNAQYNHIARSDRTLQWINIAFLAPVALVPFSTGVLSRYPNDLSAIAIYAVNQILVGVVLYGHWRYATGGRLLVPEDLSGTVIAIGTLRCLAAPLGYVVALALSVLDPRLGLALFALVPVLYILPGLERHWLSVADRMTKE